MKKAGFQILLLMLVLFVVASCGNPGVFDQYKTIPANGWHKDSLLVFDVPISSTVQKHNLYISVRNDISYKYSNLWLFVEIVQPICGCLLKSFSPATFLTPTPLR